MTAPTNNICTPDTKPSILLEIDEPFPRNNPHLDNAKTEDVPILMQIKSQEHSHAVEDFKNTVGKKLLYGCLITILSFALLDAHFHIESTIFTNAFEIAKIVATTVLGYLFGSKSKSS